MSSNPELASLPRPIAWALSGGAALGAMHVAQARALHAQGLGPDYLVGTSIGAMNAAWLGRGLTPAVLDEMERLWRGIEFADAFGRFASLGPLRLLAGKASLASNRAFYQNLRTYLPQTHDQTEIPVSVVATNLYTGWPETFSSGDLPRNVLASSAIPGIFPGVIIDGEEYVDGGVGALVPFEQALQTPAKTVVILDAGSGCRTRRDPGDMFERLLLVVSHLIHQQVRRALASRPDDVAVLYMPSHCQGAGRLSDFEASPTNFDNTALYMDEALKGSVAFLEDFRYRGPMLYGDPGQNAPEPPPRRA